jgi:hypothetical protein
MSDLAAKIAIDLLTIYGDRTEKPYDIFIDNSHYLFGKRINCSMSEYRLQYPVPPRFSIDLLDNGCNNPVELLREYLALHSCNYQIRITYSIHNPSGNLQPSGEYFEIELCNLKSS